MPNIPGWKNVPLTRLMRDALHIPVFIDNDVNLITLGEWKLGAGQGCSNLVCITLGTGVGGGLILNNALYRGADFVAGEIGHMPLNEKGPECACGGWGCFERYVGNRHLTPKAAKIFKNKKIELKDIAGLIRQGDVRGEQFWDDVGVRVGNGLVGVVNLLNPHLIVIGGGVSNNFRFFGKTVSRIIKQRAMKVQAAKVKVVRARLGDDAGLIGAHVLIKELSKNF